MESDDAIYTTPNLTPDPETGRIYGWSQNAFIKRFRAGSILPGSPMPWKAYQAMSDTELKALYNFFNSLEPVNNKVKVYKVKAAL